MARYSSDSDSDRSSRHRKKHYGRSRSSDSDSSDTGYYKKRSSKNNSSRSKSRRERTSRSKSRERSERPSKSSNYKSSATNSKDREKGRRHRSKKSQSPSPDVTRRKAGGSPLVDKTSGKAGSAATAGAKPTTHKFDITSEPKIKETILEEINAERFTPKTFSSSASSTKDNKFRNIVIDVSAETIQTPPVKNSSNSVESIFHTSIILDQEARFDKWVKKLYTLRQKAISEVNHTNLV